MKQKPTEGREQNRTTRFGQLAMQTDFISSGGNVGFRSYSKGSSYTTESKTLAVAKFKYLKAANRMAAGDY